MDITLRRIRRSPSRDGRTIDTKALYGAARAALRDQARGAGSLRAGAEGRSSRRSRPPALASAYGTIITIDRANFTLRLFKRLKLSKTYRVAVGLPGLPDADRPLLDLQQGRQPGVDGAEQAVGRRLRERDGAPAARPRIR